MNDTELFIKKNLEKKKDLLQEEHIQVLNMLYNDGVKQGCIDGYKFHEYICQSVKYTKIANELEVDDMVLNICITDLQSMGLILNTMRNPYKESEFTLTQLGLEYLKNKK